MSQTIASLTDETFSGDVTSSKEPVLVDFWAPWCAPCRAITPVLEALAKEYEGKLRIVKVNVDDSPRLAAAFRVSAIPTLILFKGGSVVEVITGALPRPALQSVLEKHLA